METPGASFFIVGLVIAMPWALALFFLAARHFYMDDRSWWLLVILAAPTALAIWVLSRNTVGQLVVSQGSLTFIRFRSFGMRSRLTLPRNDDAEVVFECVSNFGYA